VDLLITDMVMPEGMTGLELAQKLWIEKPALKLVCVSGYSAELAKLGLGLPDHIRFLQKPFHSRQLARIVRDALDEPAEGRESRAAVST
jgi:YesN/AraC family two-component response regulator